MKTKVILYYEMFLNAYFYNHKKDEETSKNLAYASVRNMIGVVLFMFTLVFFTTIMTVFKIHLNFKENRPICYLIMGVLVISYLSLTKKYLKPMFDHIEIKKEKPPKNNYYIYAVILGGLFGGGMFVIARLITIYLR